VTRLRRGLALLVLGTLLLVGLPSVAGAEQAPADRPPADRVVVVGVPGLTWSDIDPEATPALWALAEESAIGALSVRAGRSTTCVLDGWATLGAGNRARVPGPDEGLPPVPVPTVPVPGSPSDATHAPGEDGAAAPEPQLDTSLSHCGLQERAASVGLADPEAMVQRTADDRGTVRFGAEPGALAREVGCATVSGRAATLAAAVPGVTLTRADALAADPGELGEVVAGCPLTLVALNQLTGAGRPGAEKTDSGTDPEPRAAALLRIDEAVGELRAALTGDSLLVVAGISEVNDARAQLHVGMVSGPGFSSGWLSSASTGRAPFAQLIDVAPTVLDALGLDRPESMNGQPLRATGQRPALASAVQELADINTAATVHHRGTGLFFWLLVVLTAGLVALGLLVLGGLRGTVPRAARPPGRLLLRVVAIAVAALPVATYLAGIVPWERASAPGAALAAAVATADLVVLAVALGGPWRRRRLGPALAVLGLTFATLVGDVLTGSRLELNGLLGYDAIVAGRFTGYGNLTFGLLSVSALTGTAALATAAGRSGAAGRRRPVTALVVLGVGVPTVAVIGAPGLGRDFGGVLAALPGFLLLAMLLAGVRVTVVRLAAILGASVLAVSGLAVLDWLRPAADRSHLGRFVDQVLTGEAWTVISRKGSANLGILTGSPLAWMLPVAVVAAVWLLRPGGLLRRREGQDGGPGGLSPADTGVLRAALLAVLLSLTIGAAVNDSGIAVPATAAVLLVPLLVWLAAGAGRGSTGSGETAGGAPHSGPVEPLDRVTVVSRGSTVWNT
jgi:hypothetical protein